MMAAEKHMTLIERLPPVKGEYFENASLANLIWFRTGGPAEVLFRPLGEADLADFLKDLPEDVPVGVIGVGSNMLVRDGGVDGVVIKLGKPFSAISVAGDLVSAQAGAMDVTAAHIAAEAGLTGLEFFRGIPGTIGGALRMNAGAYGTEVRDVFVSARAVDRKGVIHTLSAEDMGFSYRHTDIPRDWIFLSGTFRGSTGEQAKIHGKMEDIQQAREDTQPMRVRTGGSTFKNPDNKKAWQLVDEAGCRGLMIGGAQVSETSRT